MNRNIKHSLLALAACALFASAAQANTSYNFGGVVEDGVLAGQSFSGQFSFDETLLAATPDYLMPSTLTLTFNGTVYTLATALDGSIGIAFDAGKPVGIDAVWGNDANGLVLSSGFGSPYLADTAGNFGSVTISASPVPEPASWALGLAGLAAIGLLMNRRRATR